MTASGGDQRDLTVRIMYPSAPKLPSCPGCPVTLSRVDNLDMGYFPGLSGWVLNLITHIPTRESQREITNLEEKPRERGCGDRGEGTAEQWQQPPAAGRGGREWIFPQELWRE